MWCFKYEQLVAQCWTHRPQPAQAEFARERLCSRQPRKISGVQWMRACAVCVCVCVPACPGWLVGEAVVEDAGEAGVEEDL